MRYPAGPHRRRGRRRRALKVAIIAALLSMLLASTWTPWTPSAQADAAGLSIQELVVARNLYQLSGDRGFAHEYIQQSTPEQERYIRGEQ